ncbi:FRG domain-containing protein [Microbacterium sp. LMC-P-041]|uniref:FRG domain-containing protein n=1 Tax=Microbacterium sp. LMC-P-041 TaxID=3040293 RepID=UPI0025532C65|nr:FRG domain-containing protein [Microbacterium sp. LMC-P-041]
MMESLRPSFAAMESLKSSAAVAAMAEATRPSLAASEGLTILPSIERPPLPASLIAMAEAASRPSAATLAAIEAASAAILDQAALSKIASIAELSRGGSGINTIASGLSGVNGRLPGLNYPSFADWETALSKTLAGSRRPKPRRNRKPSDFFGSFEVEVASLKQLLRALSVLQQKNSALGLVWRGQQNADWPVNSSLTRALRAAEHGSDESRLIAVERFQLAAGDQWGIVRNAGEMAFFAELQHQGAPTRLIDVSLDPEIAAWFAVSLNHDEHDAADGRIVAWGRSAAPRRNQTIEPPSFFAPPGTNAFWHQWSDAESRRTNDWGTGRAVPAWQPPALNGRMRAQRAAFLFDAEPIVDDDLLELFATNLGETWRAREIAQSTRVLGLPAAHDVKAKPNTENVVPMFSIRIAADVKRDVRKYLETKGLTENSIYPDWAGLVSYLRRVSAVETGLGKA